LIARADTGVAEEIIARLRRQRQRTQPVDDLLRQALPQFRHDPGGVMAVDGRLDAKAAQRVHAARLQPGTHDARLPVDDADHHLFVVPAQHDHLLRARLHLVHEVQHLCGVGAAVDQVAQQNDIDLARLGTLRMMGLDPVQRHAKQVEATVNIPDAIDAVALPRAGRSSGRATIEQSKDHLKPHLQRT
jgi:hypothetical protein